MLKSYWYFRNGAIDALVMDLRQETEDANVKNHIMEDFVNIKTIVKRTKIVATKVYLLVNLFNH